MEGGSDGFGCGDHETEDLQLGIGGGVDRGAASGQQHGQCLAFASAAGTSQARSAHRLACGSDRVERVGLRPVAARGTLWAVQLDDDLRTRLQVSGQPGAVAAGPFDRPRPQRRVVVSELHELGIALGCRLDGDLRQDATGRGVQGRRGVGVDVGVDADDDIDLST
jgi:hypothetical protein